jgi:putative transposase
LPDILEEVARLGAQLLMQAALEAEVTEFLGRERYQRAATTPAAADGSRNGYRPVTVLSWSGLCGEQLAMVGDPFSERASGAA